MIIHLDELSGKIQTFSFEKRIKDFPELEKINAAGDCIFVDPLDIRLGAKRLGASQRAFWGAMFGAVVGMFFGLAGIVLGPFVGAVVAEISGGRPAREAGRAGMGAWIGTVIGAALKLAIVFVMVGYFILLQFFG